MQKKFFLFILLLFTFKFDFVFSEWVEEVPVLPYGDNSPHAAIFFNVVPEIKNVQFPTTAKTGEPIKIKAKIITDKSKTDFLYPIMAMIDYKVGDKKITKGISLMNISGTDFWEGEIPPQKSGEKISFTITAYDNFGNLSTEFPFKASGNFPPADNELINFPEDPQEIEGWVPKDIDLKQISFGYDDNYFYLKLNVYGAFKQSINNPFMIFGYLIALVNPDTPALFDLLDAKALVYAPALTKFPGQNFPPYGLLNLSEMLSGKSGVDTEAGVEIKIDKKNKPGELYFKVKRKSFGNNPSNSIKIAAATLGINNLKDPNSATWDATNFYLIYLREHTIFVK